MLAADLYVVQENGPHIGGGDFRSAGNALSIVYQPTGDALARRYRCSPTRRRVGPQRGPGENQFVAGDRADDRQGGARAWDRPRAIRRSMRRTRNGKIGADRGPVTSAFLKEALDKARRDVQVGREEAALGPAQRQQGDRRRRRPGLPLGRLQRLRRPRAHHAGRQAARPHRRRQSRHLLPFRDRRASRPTCSMSHGRT